MTSVFCMAAGKGTRLSPWTLVTAKPILPVLNEPALGHLFRLAARHGYRDVVTNASWHADTLVGIFGDGSAHGVNLSWSVEEAPLGTAGGVLAAQDRLRNGDEPILVLSGDGIHDVDLAAFERAHRTSGALASLALLPVVDASEYGVAVLDADSRITGFQEKPARGTELSRLANTGIYLMQPELLDYCTTHGITDFGGELFPRMLQDNMYLHGHELADTYWNDIGDLDEWRTSNIDGLEGRIDLGQDRDAGNVLIHPSAQIDSAATVEGPCVIGAGVRIDAGAHLRSALVLPYAHVPADMVIASGTVGTLAGVERWARELCS